MSPVEGITLERDGNTTTMQCITDDEETKLICNGTAWIGSPPNCTTAEPERNEDIPQGMVSSYRYFKVHFMIIDLHNYNA